MKKKVEIKEKIINYVYMVSSQPVTFKDLLSANSHYNERMYVDPGKLGFRMSILKAYTVYLLLCATIIAPLLALTHYTLTNINFHFSIALTVIATSIIFIGFSFFRAWIRDAITLKLIKKAWIVHFPYFAYDKYAKKVDKVYKEAIKNEVLKKDLRLFVMDKLVEK